MKTLTSIDGDVENVDAFVRSELDSGRKLMGFGHRVYKTEDPRATHLRKVSEELADDRTIGETAESLVKYVSRSGTPMEALRTLISALAVDDPDGSETSPEANRGKATRLVAQMPMLVARYEAARRGRQVPAPAADLGIAGDFLLQITGERPSERAAQIMDECLVLHADHTMNASTFTARVIAATLSDMHSAITAAIAALKGPLHGGANAEVMKMLLDIGRDAGGERAEQWVRAKLARKEKIAGFGHRVYRTEDPRATHLRRFSKLLGDKTGEPQWFEMSQRIEQLVRAEKSLHPNVDFYSASAFHSLGIPIDLYTPIFAVSRISGWTAHVLEQYAHNRLIRPRTDYIGPRYPQTFLPVEQR